MALPGRASQQKQQRLEQMYKEYKAESFPEGKDISAADLHDLLQNHTERVVLVDTRTQPEQQVSIIPGAVTVSQFEDLKAEVSGRQVVAYCTVGLRSGQYARDLRKEGFDASNLAGSILAWTQEGFSLVDGKTGKPTKRLHVFAEKWALQGDGYDAVTFAKGQGALAIAKSLLPRWLGGEK
ncbi:hypothetical protein WJX81_005079 [Elliptochloris bilobata]|uniref:Rhodanese domain-containing protein n=1 Tax=Elliptochloris bilobata TaxID=381761 RepID=A0AAW1QMJ4_9CHLO